MSAPRHVVMTGADRSRSRDFNETVIAEFRANHGCVGGELADTSILLLHHIGARSGLRRVTPLAYNRLSDGRLVIAASSGGSPRHPAWFHNLETNPAVLVEIGTGRFAAVAERLEGAARAGVWPELIAAAPAVGRFQAQTSRQIPLFVLNRRGAGGSV